MNIARFLLPASLMGLLLTTPAATAFFDELDALEKELDAVEETDSSQQDDSTSGLDALLMELQEETAQPSSFSDVDGSAWYASYISFVSGRGIVTGYKDASGNPTGQYGPGDPVTVAQMLKIAMEAAGINPETCSTQKPYTTGSVGHWAERYVACAEEQQMRIIQANVDINRPALRGEVLGMIHDAFGDDLGAEDAPFSDTVGHPYEEDIAFAYASGVVSGDTDAQGNQLGTYRPNDGVNRAEAAKIVYQKLQ